MRCGGAARGESRSGGNGTEGSEVSEARAGGGRAMVLIRSLNQ